MNDLTRTLAAVATAAALGGAAWLTRPAPVSGERFDDVGELFAPDFTEPTAARSLEVVAFDEPSASFRAFNVRFDGQRWVIPSHHNYPADARERMAKAAAAFIGMRKEQVVTDSPADHQSLGVLDPSDDAAPLSGRGVRVSIRDAADAALTEVIIGKEAVIDPARPAAQAQAGQRRYVRVPGKNRVYVASLDAAAVSTSFADWIETDLLALGSAEIQRITVDRYTVDERAGTARDVESVAILRNRPDPDAPPGAPMPVWSVNADPGGPPAPNERIKDDRVDELLAGLRGLRIVGVRPKPPNVARALAGERGAAVTEMDILSMQQRGFYVLQGGGLLANEGQITASASDGVKYTLWFGEVLMGAGEAVTAGLDGPDVAPPGSADGEDPAPADQAANKENRYIFVTVAFDESALPPRPTPSERVAAEIKAEEDAKAAAPAAEPAPKSSERLEHEAALAAWEQTATQGRERAAELSRRFAQWYYVIDASSFGALRPRRADIVETTAAPAPAGPQAEPPAQMPVEPPPQQPAPTP